MDRIKRNTYNKENDPVLRGIRIYLAACVGVFITSSAVCGLIALFS